MPAENGLADEIEATVRQAADGATVISIRLAVGKRIATPVAALAAELHKRFPSASIELKESAITDSVVVKDIEVE